VGERGRGRSGSRVEVKIQSVGYTASVGGGRVGEGVGITVWGEVSGGTGCDRAQEVSIAKIEKLDQDRSRHEVRKSKAGRASVFVLVCRCGLWCGVWVSGADWV
jgi:hypothetical protein